MSQYLLFERQPPPPGRKTPIVLVRSRSIGAVLGEIRWFGRWRQFCFYPEPMTVFNAGCMSEIQKVIRELMAERVRGPEAERPKKKVVLHG